jgi:hypothetical protein
MKPQLCGFILLVAANQNGVRHWQDADQRCLLQVVQNLNLVVSTALDERWQLGQYAIDQSQASAQWQLRFPTLELQQEPAATTIDSSATQSDVSQ